MVSDSSQQKIFSSRLELKNFQAYKPGISILEIQRRYGLKNVIKLASNENPNGSSSKAISAYKKATDVFSRYPESRSTDLRSALAEAHKRDIGELIIGAGSDEIIELLAKAFLTPDDEVIVSASAFLQYKIAAHLMGAKVIEVPVKDLKHNLEGMLEAVSSQTKFIFIANPNNPTGTYNNYDEVEFFIKNLPDHVIPVFDEAYFEYAKLASDYPSVVEDFYKKRPMVVLRTFSKVYGLAGLRVGYGIAPEKIIEELDKIRPPFNVSVPAQMAALAAFRDESFVKKSVESNSIEKNRLQAQLEKMGFECVPSVTNFILFRVGPRKGRSLFEKLLEKGVIARSVDEYNLPDYLRVSIGTKKENTIFLEALSEVWKAS
ncbi:MAG: histidinol-phosphate transaminase [Elusimicrobiota bacterium]